MRVTLYSKPDCTLCDACKVDLLALQIVFGFTLEERNILDDPALFDRFRYLIPVVDVSGGPQLYPPHEFGVLWSALHNARLVEDRAHDATTD